MNTYNNGTTITKEGKQPEGKNSPFIVVKTSNGTIRKSNPAYVKPVKKSFLAKVLGV